MANQIIKDTLHPENEKGVDIYPTTSTDQVVGYNEDKNSIEKQITIGLNAKVDKSQLNSLKVPNSIPVRDENGNFEVGDASSNIEALNERVANKKYPSWRSEIVDNVDHICGFKTQDTVPKKISVTNLLAKVTSPIILISALETATNGVISAEDLTILQNNKNAMILYANEYYYLADDQHTSGYLTYSHVGVENGIQWIKSITITIANLNWVKTVGNVTSLKKYYKHSIVAVSKDSAMNQYKFTLYNQNSNEIIIPLTDQITKTYISELPIEIENVGFSGGYSALLVIPEKLRMNITTLGKGNYANIAFGNSVYCGVNLPLNVNTITFETIPISYNNFKDTVTEVYL